MFSFGSPWFLLLTPIALGPLVLHLLSRRKMRRTEFSSLFFLRKLRERRFRWLKLRDILLLILRTLFLLFLVLALSNPVWLGRFPVRISQADMVIILDDSYSTEARFSEIKKTASRLVDELAAGSKLAIITPSGSIRDTLLSTYPAQTFNESLEKLREINSSKSGHDLQQSWQQALKILDSSKASNKRIVIVTDGQTRALKFLYSERMPQEIETFVFADVNPPPENVSLLSIELYPLYPMPGEELSMRVEIGSNFKGARTSIIVYTGDRETETRSISLGKGSRVFLFDLPADIERMRIELDEDSIPADNIRFVEGKGKKKLRIALAGNVDSELLELALKVGEGPAVDRIDPSSAARLSPNSYDLLIWDTDYQFSIIDAAASQGLPVLVLLQDDPTGLPEEITVTGRSTDQGFEIMAPSDLFSDLSSEDRRQIQFNDYFNLQVHGLSTVLSFSGGDPLLAADTASGIYYSATRFTPQSTNLVYRAIFPVLIQRLAIFSAGQNLRDEYYIGDTLRVRVPKGQVMLVETPELHYEITPQPTGHGFLVEFGNTQEPGFYTIGSETFVVNPDPREASSDKIEVPKLEENGIKVYPLGASTPVKLWLFVLILAAIFLAAEFLLVFL